MRYILKKTGVLIVTLLVISMVAFLAFQVIPGDPTTRLLGMDYTPERAEQLRNDLGLNKHVVLRYIDWLAAFLGGGMGTAVSGVPVRELLSGRLPITAALSLMAFILVVLISLPGGFFLARFHNRAADRILTPVTQIIMSIPPFFTGIIFTSVFGLALKAFTPGMFASFNEDPAGYFIYLFFPALAIALPKAAMTTKLLRRSILGELGRDYVRTAYSRGSSRHDALLRHVLRNALIPVITFLALTLADIVAGSIIVEQVFAIPGIGRLLLTSISNRDYPVVQAIIVIIAGIVVIVNFIADVVCQRIDPQIRLT